MLGANGEWPCLVALLLERGEFPQAIDIPLEMSLPSNLDAFNVDLPGEAAAIHIARESTFVAPCFEATFVTAINLANKSTSAHGEAWRAVSLAIILIENGLRSLYCRYNDGFKHSVLARTDVLHLTIETLLSMHTTRGTPNQLLVLLCEGAVAALYDSFIFPEGSENGSLRRNMLVHGSIGPSDVSPHASQRIIRILLGLTEIFTQSDVENKTVFKYSQALQLYQSQNHPIVLLRQRIESLCALPSRAVSLPSDIYCTMCLLPREYCAFGPSPAICVDVSRRGSDKGLRGCVHHVHRLRQLVTAPASTFERSMLKRIENLKTTLSAALLANLQKHSFDASSGMLPGDEMATCLKLRALLHSSKKAAPTYYPNDEDTMWADILHATAVVSI